MKAICEVTDMERGKVSYALLRSLIERAWEQGDLQRAEALTRVIDAAMTEDQQLRSVQSARMKCP